MRIEAYTQTQQLYNTKKAVKKPIAQSISVSDKIQISSIGKDFQTAKAAVDAGSDIREDVIAPLKAGIANGTYHVSGESFAEKLLQKYDEISSL
ncbi:MAG: flagellar biosynthesis anti-sigma factor FlgM [Blautia sp.]|nr:flagellar biosynthesis anti-sigma factor FlgM [Muribaculaceae bacterium]MCM1143539.1 flagellar biosynthesis anti-sigma factor FlgM [Lachnoclostridium sp.]MCM1210224.1 flagellar biosynthesis anti-sigma factor FlgM [Blautia sp.]